MKKTKDDIRKIFACVLKPDDPDAKGLKETLYHIYELGLKEGFEEGISMDINTFEDLFRHYEAMVAYENMMTNGDDVGAMMQYAEAKGCRTRILARKRK